MLSRKRRTEAAQISADRRRREDEAPRLHDEVPQLVSLSLTVDERRPGIGSSGTGHIRRVVVERAPALFVMPCSAPGCEGGVHDLTSTVMRDLRRGATRFEGDTGCDSCACELHHGATAAYR
ncbi:MAG: hypothetical protein QM820_49415 [Minicystis sp.]